MVKRRPQDLILWGVWIYTSATAQCHSTTQTSQLKWWVTQLLHDVASSRGGLWMSRNLLVISKSHSKLLSSNVPPSLLQSFTLENTFSQGENKILVFFSCFETYILEYWVSFDFMIKLFTVLSLPKIMFSIFILSLLELLIWILKFTVNVPGAHIS
jgi:hypothetical protein